MLRKVQAETIKLIRSISYFIVCFVHFLIFMPFVKVSVSGRENIPKKGRVILAANHQNFFDGFFIAYVLGPFVRPCFLIARRSLKFMFWRFLAKLIGCVVISDDVEDYQRSLKKLNNILSHGGKVVIFPEGTVSNKRIPRKFKGGVAKLSYDSRSLVVPIYLNGTYDLRYFKYWLKRPEIFIKIGKPVPLYNYFGSNGNNLDKIADFLREKIIELCDIKEVQKLVAQEIEPKTDMPKLLLRK